MTMRQESIKKLKNAVKNETLLMYQAENGTTPKYYDNETNSCCAVGAILPLEILFKHMNHKGNVHEFSNNGRCDYSVDEQLGKSKNSLYGIKKDELIDLQRLHDKAMSYTVHGNAKAGYRRKFEQYVKALK